VLPKCEIRLKARRPKKIKEIEVTTDTITNWELGRNVPLPHYIPKILAHLGYTPIFDLADTQLSKRLRQFMYIKGLKQKECAEVFGIDSETVSRIVEGKNTYSSIMQKIEQKLKNLMYR
jgi:DNA-binding Xre family transcriptional regulator